jgi:hypothetical protein
MSHIFQFLTLQQRWFKNINIKDMIYFFIPIHYDKMYEILLSSVLSCTMVIPLPISIDILLYVSNLPDVIGAWESYIGRKNLLIFSIWTH